MAFFKCIHSKQGAGPESKSFPSIGAKTIGAKTEIGTDDESQPIVILL